MGFRDYVIRQHQQERMAQRLKALFTKDEDHAAAAAQGIENLAYRAAQEAAAAYDYIEESRTDVITQARDLRARIESGMVPEKDARMLLADLPKQCDELVAKIGPTKSKYDSAQADLKDPRRQEGRANREIPRRFAGSRSWSVGADHTRKSAGRCFPRRSSAATARDLTAADGGRGRRCVSCSHKILAHGCMRTRNRAGLRHSLPTADDAGDRCRMMRIAIGRSGDQFVSEMETSTRVDRGNFKGVLNIKIRKQAWNSLGQHRLADAGRPMEEHVMATRCSHLTSPLSISRPLI
jgi:hypothetical protein